MQLETILHMQEMTNREYMEDQDAEEPDDFISSLTAQITRRDEEMAPFVSALKRNYIFGGICSVAANASIRALADMKCINLLGVQQICRNSIALEQALAAIPAINSEGAQQRLDHVRAYYELLNMPFEAVLAFITEHEYLFTAAVYANLLKVQVPGREIPADAKGRVCIGDSISLVFPILDFGYIICSSRLILEKGADKHVKCWPLFLTTAEAAKAVTTANFVEVASQYVVASFLLYYYLTRATSIFLFL